MGNVNTEVIEETIKHLPEDQQEVILHLAEVFKGEEDIINEYFKNELNKE